MPTNSYCCHPGNIFSVDDIDEDGINELGLWESSCVSRWKKLSVYTLKKNEWKEVGHCGIAAVDYDEKKKRIQKTSKGKFRMYEDLKDYPLNRTRWLNFEF